MALGASLPSRLSESTGTTYYVGGTGANDANTGTDSSLPWATLDHAFQNAPANAIVRVRAGTYTETIVVARGGSAGNTITVQADDPASKPTLVGTLTFQTTSAAYWRIKNLICNANGATVGFKVTRDVDPNCAHHIEFDGCEAFGTVGQGAGFQYTGTEVNNVQCWNCLSYGNDATLTTAHGWYINGGHDLYLVNCLARDNGGYGFHVYNGTGTSQVVKRCYFHNCLADGNLQRSGWLISSDATQANAQANPDLLNQDVHLYNCMASNQPGASSSYGYRVHYGNITDTSLISGFIGHSMLDCLSYNNNSGDIGGTHVAGIVTDTGTITGSNPSYVASASNNFHLNSSSPAYNVGDVDTTPTTDYDGNTRTVATLGPFKAPEEIAAAGAPTLTLLGVR